MTIDGEEVHKIENKDPRIFPNVKVFAGDKFLPPADVVYRNLTWDIVSETEEGNEEKDNEKEEENEEEEIEQEEGIRTDGMVYIIYILNIKYL